MYVNFLAAFKRTTARLPARAALGISLAIGAVLICAAAEPQRDVDGLVRVQSRGIDHLYVLPEADFAKYNRVRLDPVDVSFDERWAPNARSRGARRLSDRDIENIKSSVAEEFEKTVENELKQGGYTLVDENGPDVLRVTPSIVNLYISAPGQQSAPNARVYVANTGHMTLAAVARDSVTGEILARAVDTQRGRRTGRLELANSVTNMAAARGAFTQWARVLRTGLDDARKSSVANAGESRTMR